MAWDWQSINWAPVVITTLSTGALTALGAGFGAYWGGRPLTKFAARTYKDDKKERTINELEKLKCLLKKEFNILSVRPQMLTEYTSPNDYPFLRVDHQRNNELFLQYCANILSLTKVNFPSLYEASDTLSAYVEKYIFNQEVHYIDCMESMEEPPHSEMQQSYNEVISQINVLIDKLSCQ